MDEPNRTEASSVEVTLHNEGTQRRVLHSGIARAGRPIRTVMENCQPVPDPGKLIILDPGQTATVTVADHVVDLIRSRPNDTLYVVGDRPPRAKGRRKNSPPRETGAPAKRRKAA
jgi:hypothetical protein